MILPRAEQKLVLVYVLVALTAAVQQQAPDLAAASKAAKTAMERGEFRRAVELYERLTRAVPNDPGLRMNLGLARFSAGMYRAAIGDFERVLAARPEHAALWLLTGIAHNRLSDSAAAVAPLRRAVALQSGNPRALLELSSALIALERYAEAIPHLQALSRLEPASAEAWYGLGAAHAGMSRAAFALLEEVAPESAYAAALLAESRRRQGDLKAAFHLYRKAARLQPDLRGVHEGLAGIYRETGHSEWAAAEQKREDALPRACIPERSLECAFLAGRHQQIVGMPAGRDPEALFWHAKARSALALDAYSRVDALPDSAVKFRMHAEGHRLARRYSEAAVQWSKAMARSPQDDSLKFELAKDLLRIQDYGRAEPLLKDTLSRRPDSFEANYLLGEALLGLQQSVQAAEVLRRANSIRPSDRAAALALGRALLQSGRAEEAVAALRPVLPHDRDGSAHFTIAQALSRSGRKEEAARIMADRHALMARIEGAQSAEAGPITAPE